MKRPAAAALVLVSAALLWLWLGTPIGPDVPPATGDGQQEPRPASGSPLRARAQELIDVGQAGDALALLAADERATLEELPAALLLVDLSRHLEPGETAVERGRRLVERWPDQSAARHAWAQALGTHMRTGGMLAAVRWLATFRAEVAAAVTLDPTNVEAAVTAIGFHVYAPTLVGADRDEAARLSRELMALDEPAGAMMLALTHAQLGEDQAALALCRDVARRHPAHQELHVVFAALLLDAGDLREAGAAIDAILAGPATAAWWRGLHLRVRLGARQGRAPAEQLADLELLATRAPPADYLPSAAQVACERGEALELLGRTDEARAAYAQALELEPDLPRAAEALARLP